VSLLTPKFAAVGDTNVLNVHIVSHTHDDVGWLKTVEQYYYGRNNTIQHAAVKYILSTVMQALVENPNRTFTYVEQKFFSMWWAEQSFSSKKRVKELIENNQLSFVNGGWCMHDEATTHFMGMIDQTTLGHSFLRRELGVVPTVGWQLDPFGHSATMASLLTAKLGFDALYFGRIDYQDMKLRHESQECEGLWNSSPDLNETVFWGLTGSYQGNYGAPPGYCFDFLCQDEPLVGDSDEHLLERVIDFVDALKVQSDRTKGNHIMLTMGSDFQYENALENYANLDLLISSILSYQSSGRIDVPSRLGPRFKRINVFYSSPDYYTEWKYKETMQQREEIDTTRGDNKLSTQWSVKTDDFFPYSDCPHCFWTGYFTSRAGFKRLERVGSSFLQAARQIESMKDSEGSVGFQDCHCMEPLYPLEDAMGIVQHHDAVSGTAKQHVANDYAKRIQEGINQAASAVSEKLKRILLLDKSDTSQYLKDLALCQLLNETKCDVSTKASGRDLYVVVYNALAKQRSAIISVPLPTDTALSDSQEVTVRRIWDDEGVTARTALQVDGSSVLYFNTGLLPPIGGSVFRISVIGVGGVRSDLRNYEPGASSVDRRLQLAQRSLSVRNDISFHHDKNTVEVSNGILSVRFDRSTGMIQHISNEKDGSSLAIQQELGYYISFDSSKDSSNDKATQNSSAYIFRPSQSTQRPVAVTPAADKASFVETDVGVIIDALFEEPWVKQTTKVFMNQPYVEIEYTVGPIPIHDGRGKEFVTKLCSPIQSNGLFYTDSNGREFLPRKRGYRPTWNLTEYEWVAGNYYPVNAATYVEDEESSLAVVVDRSQGGSSLANGCIEIMIQRRTLTDDSRGVAEAMNETVGGMSPYPPYGNAERIGEGVVIKAKHRVMVGKGKTGASLARSQMDEAFSEPMVFCASAPKDSVIPFKRGSFSLLKSALPNNVMLVTFTMLHVAPSTTFLIRLGHQYASNKSKTLSGTAHVNMQEILADWKVVSMTEKTLSGNQDYSEWENRRFYWNGDSTTNDGKMKSERMNDYDIELMPMEIRTFEVRVE
jgi:hypothetical protein